jgi:serine/threonine protein kinase
LFVRILPDSSLRPENILYQTKDPGSDIVIVDFGMSSPSAKHLHPPDEQLHSLAGSIGYVAPEVLNKEGHGKPADIWATGFVLVFHHEGYTRKNGYYFSSMRSTNAILPSAKSSFSLEPEET